MTNQMETRTVSLDDISVLATSILTKAGMDDASAGIIADIVTMSERDGPRSHGLRMLPAYVQSFESGYANPTANPKIDQTAPGALVADADNGYFQIAAFQARDQLRQMARDNGIAAFSCSNCHHLAGLRFDTEPYAENGLIALAVINSLSMIVPYGGKRPVYGTNPMSFACPRDGAPPIVWDQASSVVALMDVRMAASEGHELHLEGGLDAEGKPTKDPNAVLETRSLLPFGDHKGSAIALMVEILGAALAGGTMSVDNQDREAHGALNIKGGATLIVIDPSKFGNAAFGEYVRRICAEIDGNGDARVPGDGRLKKRQKAEVEGVEASVELLQQLEALKA